MILPFVQIAGRWHVVVNWQPGMKAVTPEEALPPLFHIPPPLTQPGLAMGTANRNRCRFRR